MHTLLLLTLFALNFHIAVQDWYFRRIYTLDLLSFIACGCMSVILIDYKQSVGEFLEVFTLLVICLSITKHSVEFLIKKNLTGWGDVLFLAGAMTLINLTSWPLFLILSGVLALTYGALNPTQKHQIPLVSVMSGALWLCFFI